MAGLGDLEEIYLQYVGPIRSYLYRLSGNHHLAEDLVQEVFYRATRSLLAGQQIQYVSAWLYRIARNLYLNHTRHRDHLDNAWVELEETPFTGQTWADPDLVLQQKELHRQIMEALGCLAEKQRTVLLLRDYHSLSYAEIASVMGLSPSAVKSLLFRARLTFRANFTTPETQQPCRKERGN